MTCKQALILISGKLDGENTPEENTQLQLHLDGCPQCRAALQAFTDTDQTLFGMAGQAPADFCGKVMAAVSAEQPARKRKSRKWLMPAVAAAVLAVSLGIGYLPALQSQQQIAPMARTAPAPAASHGVETAAAFSGDAPSVTVWPQTLAEELQADVTVAYERLKELEDCPCEALEDGTLLYTLPTAGYAATLSQTYELELYPASETAADVSYALLLPR